MPDPERKIQMAEEKKGFFRRLVDGLSKTRSSIVSGFDTIFAGYSSIDDDFYDEIEEILIKIGEKEAPVAPGSEGMQGTADGIHQKPDGCRGGGLCL